MLRRYLEADLARQYRIEGKPNDRPSLLQIISRLLHHRFLPLVLYRVARATFLHNIPFLPQLCTYLNIVLFGIEISPRCEIGGGLFLPHTVGTVIGAARMGRNITIFQGVTLGAKDVDMTFEVSLRPCVEDDVTLGAGSKILGGITIGRGCRVGANAVVITDIEPGTKVVGIPAMPIPAKRNISKRG